MQTLLADPLFMAFLYFLGGIFSGLLIAYTLGGGKVYVQELLDLNQYRVTTGRAGQIYEVWDRFVQTAPRIRKDPSLPVNRKEMQTILSAMAKAGAPFALGERVKEKLKTDSLTYRGFRLRLEQ